VNAAKKINGRKRHIAVDTLGLPIKYHVTVADVQDRDALAPLPKAVCRKSPWIELASVNGGYVGDDAQRAA
jgi:Transposase DDE domain